MGSEACWVLVECPQGKVLRESLEALAAARSLQKPTGMQTVALWAGARIEDAQVRHLSSLGVERLFCLEGRETSGVRVETLLAGLKGFYLREPPRYFFFGASPLSLSLAPRLAALLNVGYAPRITYIRRLGDALSLTRPLAQGKLSEMLRFLPPGRGILSLYPRSFELPQAAGRSSGQPLVPERVDLRGIESETGWELIESRLDPAESIDLEDAEIVVAGGKGIGSQEGFELLRQLAQVLGGTVGASRIAVDLGWAPKEQLVGQTGKKVAPDLYVACGISGAHQHRAGMKDSRSILAINTDPQAPIFQIATWGIVGDAQQVVKELIRHARQSGSRSAS